MINKVQSLASHVLISPGFWKLKTGSFVTVGSVNIQLITWMNVNTALMIILSMTVVYFKYTHCKHGWETKTLNRLCIKWVVTNVCLHLSSMVHVLQVCQHPNTRMREWGAEALTALIKAGLAFKHDPPLAHNQVWNSTEITQQFSVFY